MVIDIDIPSCCCCSYLLLLLSCPAVCELLLLLILFIYLFNFICTNRQLLAILFIGSRPFWFCICQIYNLISLIFKVFIRRPDLLAGCICPIPAPSFPSSLTSFPSKHLFLAIPIWLASLIWIWFCNLSLNCLFCCSSSSLI